MTSNLLTNTANSESKINYSVLVEAKEGGYQATVWGLPDCQVFSATREEALNNLHELVNTRFQNVEIVNQEIQALKSEHPWMKFAGKYKDDPQFDDMLADIEAYRRELDAEMEEYYRQFDAEEEIK
ncbi:type II toxin-antitoxin system HicB family antitoxin [Desmonostoc muscorum CCALA 125]|uniref:Type II toxin-antitoxin system HicB family antitoxin n=2 Tax=Desmonostoc muscorum TaxID=1179 RepID=A0A8J7D587_DESMC|nr:type II toxin-antitoxin system HicB family antitoxin [Desmonostoc muscorum CCALA 125]MCF2151644.1 type II toxin-antitoxin system HicB family antitoxin [Desmonostoc muscorum LEGE 12446]